MVIYKLMGELIITPYAEIVITVVTVRKNLIKISGASFLAAFTLFKKAYIGTVLNPETIRPL